jgi:hypothetical protein
LAENPNVIEHASLEQFQRTWRFVFNVVGIVTGTGALLGLVKSGFDIELYSLPFKFYETYAALRDLIFWPIEWLLAQLDVR